MDSSHIYFRRTTMGKKKNCYKKKKKKKKTIFDLEILAIFHKLFMLMCNWYIFSKSNILNALILIFSMAHIDITDMSKNSLESSVSFESINVSCD